MQYHDISGHQSNILKGSRCWSLSPQGVKGKTIILIKSRNLEDFNIKEF